MARQLTMRSRRNVINEKRTIGRRYQPDWTAFFKFGLLTLAIASLFAVTIYRPGRNGTHVNGQKAGRDRCSPNKPQLYEVTTACHVDTTNSPSPTISCFRLDIATNLSLLLSDLTNLKSQGFETAQLVLTDSTFKNGEISQDWLPLTTAHPLIKSLTISGGNLKRIGNNSFSSMADLEILTLEKTDLTALHKEDIKVLKKLDEINLRDNLLLTSIENGFLCGMPISSVQIQGLDTTSFDDGRTFFGNLSGGELLRSVKILDLEMSSIPEFPANIVPKLPYLETLRIDQCMIKSFEPKAFESAPSLKQIYMKTNLITTLNEDIFSAIVQNGVVIYAVGNIINCDCKMKWLQQFIIRERDGVYGDFEKINCSAPEDFRDHKFLDVNLCGDDLTTRPATTSSTTLEPPNSDEITCPLSASKKSTLSSIFHFGKPRFEIIEPENDYIFINVSSEEITFPAVFIYFTSDSVENMSCKIIRDNYMKSISDDKIKLEDTNPNADYIFCLSDYLALNDGKNQRMDCRAFRTQPVAGQRVWLTRDQVTTTYTYIGLVVFFGLLLGAVAAFFLIRNRPTLLRGSRRVEIVKTRNRDLVLVMPDKITNKIDTPLATGSSVYDSISGYISIPTPMARGKGQPPPVPPIPPQWVRRSKEEHVYLEPCRYPKNFDLLQEYEWYTQRMQAESAENNYQ